ncbi:MAG: hypothetical protein ACRYFX_25290 [Janthinobacterium lividum]
MKTFNPSFRWLLFAVDSVFVFGRFLLAIHTSSATAASVRTGFLPFITDTIYGLLLICLMPAACAVLFGGFGNVALQMLAKRENAFWSYALLLLAFGANSLFLGQWLASEYPLLNSYAVANFLMCATCFGAVYHKVVFRRPVSACCAAVRHWLAA